MDWAEDSRRKYMKLLELQNVEKVYKKVTAVNDLSFAADSGEMIGLLGVNGAGKSTTIEMIATLLKPDGGFIYYKGKDIQKDPRFIRREMGYVPQEIMLFLELTGRQNLDFWGRAYGLSGQTLKKAIAWVVELCELGEQLDRPVGEYSGGMQRRINVGTAILHRPQLLILDEATVGMDILAAAKIMKMLQSLNQSVGTTILLASHNMAETESLCQRFLLLRSGRLMADATTAELRQNDINLREWFVQRMTE